MAILYRQLKWGLLAIVALSLGGCLGGSVAQQLASSVAMQVADKVADDAFDTYALQAEQAQRHVILKDSEPDPYWAAFITSGFSQVSPVVEPLPIQAAPTDTASTLTSTPLVRVEIWNLLVGDEKLAFLEKARLQGTPNLPPKSDWQHWQVAAGALADDTSRPLLFLIPPGFGRVASGEMALVEIAGAGEMHHARYALN